MSVACRLALTETKRLIPCCLAAASLALGEIPSVPESPEIAYFVDRGSARAMQELIKQSQLKGIFKPFGWLMREDMYSALFEPNMLSKPGEAKVISELENYRYVHVG
jgi:hypothetical protein